MTVAAPAHPDQGDEGVLVRQLGRQAHGAQDQEDPRGPRVCLQVRGVVVFDMIYHWDHSIDIQWLLINRKKIVEKTVEISVEKMFFKD